MMGVSIARIVEQLIAEGRIPNDPEARSFAIADLERLARQRIRYVLRKLADRYFPAPT